MKFFTFPSILMIVLLCLLFDTVNTETASGEEREPVCDVNATMRCPRIYEPVCGSDKRTYDNECLLCRERQKRKVSIRITKNGRC
ncbi:serine protease inhibitor Kazal-type 1-like [Mantella aurantiaca]